MEKDQRDDHRFVELLYGYLLNDINTGQLESPYSEYILSVGNECIWESLTIKEVIEKERLSYMEPTDRVIIRLIIHYVSSFRNLEP